MSVELWQEDEKVGEDIRNALEKLAKCVLTEGCGGHSVEGLPTRCKPQHTHKGKMVIFIKQFLKYQL